MRIGAPGFRATVHGCFNRGLRFFPHVRAIPASCKAGQIRSGHKAQAGAVEFWVRAMVSHTCHLKKRAGSWTTVEAFVEGLGGYVQHYYKFVSVRLLGVSDLGGAKARGRN